MSQQKGTCGNALPNHNAFTTYTSIHEVVFFTWSHRPLQLPASVFITAAARHERFLRQIEVKTDAWTALCVRRARFVFFVVV